MPQSLEVLILNGNNFTGGIPTEWVSLTKLKTLNVADCGLDGPLPVEWWPQSLSDVHLNGNKFTGPIPVELLRWKFAEGRTIELKGNAGLELPSNLGELGDSVTKIDLSEHALRGMCCAAHVQHCEL